MSHLFENLLLPDMSMTYIIFNVYVVTYNERWINFYCFCAKMLIIKAEKFILK